MPESWDGNWLHEDWYVSDEAVSGGEQGRKWAKWWQQNLPYGFITRQLDPDTRAVIQGDPVLTIPPESILRIGARGLDMVLRFTLPEYPGKDWLWVVEAITPKGNGFEFQVQRVTDFSADLQVWRLDPISREFYEELWKGRFQWR